ncbi:MAG TPA: hypothetical protein VFH68_08290 [Polyangia bacterium]|nr:hypothetical protein [Polyangia bacterium]
MLRVTGLPVVAVVAALLTTAGAARAQAPTEPPGDEGTMPPAPLPHASARDVAGSGLFLVGLQPAQVTPVAGSGIGVAGFDGARHTSVFSASAEVALARWLVLRGEAIYRPSNPDDRAVARPAVSLRGRLLDQQSAGVNLALVAGYSQEKLAGEGGMLHFGAAIGRSFDRLSLIGNLAVGGDPEGDDRDGTLGGAALWRASPSLHVGGQAFFRRDLGSTDGRRLLRKDGQYDYAVGPVASYARDVVVFAVQTGVSGVRGAGTSALGLLALGGVGAVF